MEPARKGKTIEYRRGNYILAVTTWDGGMNEVELWECHAVLLHREYCASPPDVDSLLEKATQKVLPIPKDKVLL